MHVVVVIANQEVGVREELLAHELLDIYYTTATIQEIAESDSSKANASNKNIRFQRTTQQLR